MVYIDDNTKEKIEKLKLQTIYFLISFDNVITDANSVYTWDAITNNIKLKKRQMKRIDDNINKIKSTILTSDIENEEKDKILRDIWLEHINIINESVLNERKLNRILSNLENLKIRNGVQDFFKFTYEKNIPVVIVSTGIYEVIDSFLEFHKCKYDNIHIIANKLSSGINQNIIHPLNKSEAGFTDEILDKIKDKKTAILLASSITDLDIVPKESLKGSIKVAYLDKFINDNFDIYLNYFNMICTHNASFDSILSGHRN
jgi:2-hydroxy-3-keto-5-methylthiopentenyl-1-phosphate phosphatase